MSTRYSYVVGTGGIGKGILFEIEGNATLGRCESRLATLTNNRDYCKIHIIFHYVAAFLRGKMPVYAVGRVGNDSVGDELIAEIKRAGIKVDHIAHDPDAPTMYTVCFQYPDGDGGNITADNSACGNVCVEDIDNFFNSANPTGKGIVMAAPEVPVQARVRLLQRGRERGCFNVAAVLTSETREFYDAGGFDLTDLLAINGDEATAIAALESSGDGGVGQRCLRVLQARNPDIMLAHTMGRAGSEIRYRDQKRRCIPLDADRRSTAGAGDCFIGTIIAALALGVELFPADGRFGAAELGNMASSMKVESRDTIHFGINPQSLVRFAEERGVVFSGEISSKFFGE